jgi:soluble lytic murein transglycosylase
MIVLMLSGLYFVPRLLYPLDFQEEIETAAGEYGVPTSLIAAVIKAESGFRPRVVSEKDAYGLMQVTEPTAWWIESQNGWEADLPQGLLEPEVNIQYGVWYLSYLSDKYDSEELALIAYNAGPGTVDRWLKEGTVTADDLSRIPYGETAEYLKRVKRNRNMYQWIYQLDDQLEEIKED